ncbi:MAG: glycosyltransferase, partial [Proteobacteria bacterium]|nr:glycosyltransferase [Pseudomonadota bacterium]
MASTVEIVIPVLNEERALPGCLRQLVEFTNGLPDREWRFLVADNGSEDRTRDVATELAEENPAIGVMRLEQRGRGRAVRQAWLESDADVRCYMDVDLSTDLKSLPDLVSAVADEGYDLAIGSRLLRDSEVVDRPFTREVTSRGYSLIFRSMFFTSFKDAQCGFKAIGAEAARKLLPLVRDNGWFF